MNHDLISWAGALMMAVSAAWIRPAPSEVVQDDTVLIHALVEDEDGSAVGGLSEEDFQVVSGGASRRIVNFSSARTPMTVLFIGDVSKSVIDRSRSQTANWIDPITSAAEHFVRALEPGDRGRLMSVAGSDFQVGPSWTSDRRTLEASARRLVPAGPPGQPSPIWDAVHLAVPLFDNEPGRAAIVMVTDGRGGGNQVHADEAADRAMRAGVAVSIIELEATPQTLEIVGEPVIPSPGPLLRTVAASTGGLHLVARVNPRLRIHDPGPLVANALQRLRTSYTLRVAVPGASGDRTLDVRVRRAGLVVHARRGY